MARQKRSSRVLKDALQRAVSLKTIHEDLELTSDLTLKQFNEEIDLFRAKLEAYNGLLAQIDVTQAEISEDEQRLQHLTSDMLTGVASKYGKDSYEYKMAGGTRRSERKRSVRKPKPIAI